MEAHVGVGVVLQGMNQGGDRGRRPLFAQRLRRVGAQMGIGVIEEIHQWGNDVEIAHGQNLQRAVQQAGVLVLVVQGAQQRAHGVGAAAARQAIHRDPAHAPTLIAQCADQRFCRIQVCVRGEALGRVQTLIFVRAVQLLGQVTLAIHARRHIANRHQYAGHVAAVPDGRQGDMLLHGVEMRRRLLDRAADQVMMKRRRQNLGDACAEHAFETAHQAACRNFGEQGLQRLTQGSALTHAGNVCQPVVPRADDQMSISCKNTYPIIECCHVMLSSYLELSSGAASGDW